MFDDLENNLYVLAKSLENTVIPSPSGDFVWYFVHKSQISRC